jgi:CelD/BcsL family acetyltransferase involved in cellulose biosynthesis
MYRINFARNIDPSKWGKLLLNSKDATVFHTYEWVQTLNKTYPNYKPLFLVASDEDGELVGGMPIIALRQKGFRHFLSMPFGTYGGFLIKDNMDENLRIAGLKKFYRLTRWNHGESIVIDFPKKCGFLESLGFEWKKNFTHVLELNLPFDEIWTKIFSKKVRNETRQALKRGVVTEELKDASQLEGACDMISKTYERHKIQPYPLKLYENILGIMGERKLVRWLIAKYNEKPIATSMFFTFKDNVIYWMNASYVEYRNLQPNNLLLSEMIKWSCENGYKYFNFGASPSEANGLIRFKENWGARKTEYNSYEKVSPTFKFASFCKRILSRRR